MTTKSFNCANQMGPGTDSTAFKFNGQMLLGPGNQAGNFSVGSGLSAATSPGGYTVSQTGGFGLNNINFNVINPPITLVDNDSGILGGGVTYFLPANPSAGDTYRILSMESTTTINMGTASQVAYVNANRTSAGGSISGKSSNSSDGVTIICAFGGSSAIYICYGVMGNLVLN